ncbi:NADP-dependent 3-hydroxy acid dehydrogenase YdfG [Cohaesibacter sp. ES.047]|uniref:SDR family NAD(P)-dependent oxidoreductase n=1 Tax=Cohaesibacter sp. ES.047 TaxID=1798205 RepID=UPI000BB6F50F|nr:SDR family NAD(P)-dependent oxidoreductase [Cohaesibacter sp. ES.047]SNY90193.1 NADP-dependent 3-hydroxy acid dehydrogenase YdfG [Cohaesibacter sp. ES.047]
MLEPNGRVIMISGANRGIGLAVARQLLDKGFCVSAGARSIDALGEAFAGADSDRLLCSPYDAADRNSHEAWLQATIDRFGKLDGLVNNAGTSNTFTIEAGDEEELDTLWAINIKGPLFLTRICMPHLKAAGTGRVINIASLSGKRVRNENVAYNMTKHALIALTHNTRRIGWDHGVRATAICPSFVATDLTDDVAKVSKEEMIQPEDFAEVAALALSLPNTACMAEMIVNCRLEDTF